MLQMFSHGVIAGLLFAVVGRMVYDRTHTRQFAELETMHLGRRMPFAAGAFVIAGMASMGLPGFSGFVAELQVLIGCVDCEAVVDSGGRRRHCRSVWRTRGARCRRRSSPIGCRRLKSILRRDGQKFDAITWPEIAGTSLLMAATLIVGVWPRVSAGLD